MRLEQLEYLVEIDRHRSITQAAKALYTTQPALSVVVAGIERELGFPIFRRTKQGVEPTSKGEKVIAEAHRIMRYYHGWRALDESGGEISGDLHLTTTPVVARACVPELIAAMRSRCPKVQFYLNEVQWTDAFQYIANNRSNIVFMSLTREGLEDLEIFRRKNGRNSFVFARDEYRVICSTKNPLSNRASLCAEDLREVPFVLYMHPGDKLNDKLRRLLPEGGPRFMVNSDTLIWQLVSRDLAVSTAPLSAARENYYVEQGLVKVMPLEGLEHEISHVLLYAAPELLTPAERAFVELVRETQTELDR